MIAGPAASAQVGAVEKQLGFALPGSLRQFFSIGSAGLDCHYVFEPGAGVLDDILPQEKGIFGGARLGPLSDLADSRLPAFLHAWDRLAYVGPEHWLPLEFVDGRGYLDPESERAARLRSLLTA